MAIYLCAFDVSPDALGGKEGERFVATLYFWTTESGTHKFEAYFDGAKVWEGSYNLRGAYEWRLNVSFRFTKDVAPGTYELKVVGTSPSGDSGSMSEHVHVLAPEAEGLAEALAVAAAAGLGLASLAGLATNRADVAAASGLAGALAAGGAWYAWRRGMVKL